MENEKRVGQLLGVFFLETNGLTISFSYLRRQQWRVSTILSSLQRGDPQHGTSRMDQAASVISDPSSALYITFFPRLTATPVPVPKGAVFICANSLVVADKAVGAKRGYNLRVVETLVGARVLGNALGVLVGEKEKVTYREVLGRWIGEMSGKELGVEELVKGLEKIVEKLEVLKPKGWSEGKELGVTMEEMIELSGLDPGVFREVYLSWVEGEWLNVLGRFCRSADIYAGTSRSVSFPTLQTRQACLY
jgi:hypothetical protein